MISKTLAVAIALAAAALTACRSGPPQRFYVLDPVPSSHPLNSTPQASVQIAAVNVPPALDRQEMVRRQASDTLEISPVNRWGAPFADMVQNVLTQDLMSRLPRQAVVLPRNSAPAGTLEITIDILQFGNDSSSVVLDAGWSLYVLGSDTPKRSHNIRLTEQSASSEYGEQARTMSKLLGLLADDIATSLIAARL